MYICMHERTGTHIFAPSDSASESRLLDYVHTLTIGRLGTTLLTFTHPVLFLYFLACRSKIIDCVFESQSFANLSAKLKYFWKDAHMSYLPRRIIVGLTSENDWPGLYNERDLITFSTLI